jgi:hypothetical protein
MRASSVFARFSGTTLDPRHFDSAQRKLRGDDGISSCRFSPLLPCSAAPLLSAPPLLGSSAPPAYRFGGRVGRTSIREGSVRAGMASRSITSSAMSSGWIFQSSPWPGWRALGPENSVATLPGMM